jgi:hypothetical protein
LIEVGEDSRYGNFDDILEMNVPDATVREIIILKLIYKCCFKVLSHF